MRSVSILLLLFHGFLLPLTAAEKPRPLMRDFIGLNGHTVQFKPALYAPVAKLIRDYHPLKWDIGDDTSFPTTFPFARNRVDWSKIYGSWVAAGLRVNASILFDDIPPGEWKDLQHDAATYGESFARAFGPSSKALVESIEIGNEPGKYSDAEYRELFAAMAGGARKGDPRLRIAPCAINLGPSGRYSKSVDGLRGLEGLYDLLSIHLYAEVEPWPTWRRSYPEDPKTKFVEHLRSVLTWRSEHAPDKELWLTEFGWDATTKPPPSSGDFAKWIGSTELQQAQWIIRAWLIAARLGLDRAYLFFFNDDDTPHLHASSGLTRNFQPKPSYYAAVWLQRSLGDYRFIRVGREDAAHGYIYEFSHGTDPKQRILAVWKPEGGEDELAVPLSGGTFLRAERMPLKSGTAEELKPAAIDASSAKFRAGESPIFVWVRDAP